MKIYISRKLLEQLQAQPEGVVKPSIAINTQTSFKFTEDNKCRIEIKDTVGKMIGENYTIYIEADLSLPDFMELVAILLREIHSRITEEEQPIIKLQNVAFLSQGIIDRLKNNPTARKFLKEETKNNEQQET